MGMVLSQNNFSPGRDGILMPVVYVQPNRGIERQAISINHELSIALSVIAPKRRAMRMNQVLRSIVQELPEDAIICEFDALFHPEYQIDVLQMLIAVCRTKPFSLIWPGTYEGGKLIYAEEGRPDYKVFEIVNYDITCVR